jgi:hypothetical protein
MLIIGAFIGIFFSKNENPQIPGDSPCGNSYINVETVFLARPL